MKANVSACLHRGGESDGRSLKGRRRGAMRVEAKKDVDVAGSTASHQANEENTSSPNDTTPPRNESNITNSNLIDHNVPKMEELLQAQDQINNTQRACMRMSLIIGPWSQCLL